MKKTIVASATKHYSKPLITAIDLDNEISLAMESDANPMGEPDGGGWNTQNQKSIANDPFKSINT